VTTLALTRAARESVDVLDLTLIVTDSAFAAMMLAAFIILRRNRHRSRFATNLAFFALIGFLGWFLLGLLWMCLWTYYPGIVPQDGWVTVIRVHILVRSLWETGCILLLFVAVVVDRRPAR
jgi:hypothetical protein